MTPELLNSSGTKDKDRIRTKQQLYGWDKYREEGLAELKRIISSKFFEGKDKLIDFLGRYYNWYKDNKDLSGQVVAKELFKESDDYKSASDKANKRKKELIKALDGFYETEEGKKSQFQIYFINHIRDYRIGIEKIDKFPTTADFDKDSVKLPEPTIQKFRTYANLFGEKLLNFCKIYSEAWIMPDTLVKRSSSKKFNWDTILLFIISSILIALIFKFTINTLKLNIESLFIHPFINLMFHSRIHAMEKVFYEAIFIGLPLNLFRFFIISTLISWVIYKKIFKGNVDVFNLINFQLYFLLSWIPVFTMLLTKHIFIADEKSQSLWIMISFLLLLYFLYLYFYSLNKIFGFSKKRGLLSFTVYIISNILFLRIVV